MRSTEEKIARMHERAAELAHQEGRSRLIVSGLLSAFLMVCLLFMVLQMQHTRHMMISGQTTGSSLLSESAGGYVLVSVVAFFAGVVVTAGIYYFRKREKGEEDG